MAGEQTKPPTIQEETVRDLLLQLDCHKSMGPNEIHLRVLRDLAEVIAEPLSIIYQRSLLMGEVPEDWRLASVTPIYKKGCREDLHSLLDEAGNVTTEDKEKAEVLNAFFTSVLTFSLSCETRHD